MNRLALGSLLAAAAVLLACPSKEERLLAKKQDLRVLLDELYASYRPAQEKPRAADQDAASAVGRFVSELDRTAFEAHCLAVGRGERPFSFSERIDAFTREPDHAERCRKAARLEVEIEALERELGKP